MKYQKRGLYFGHMISCETGRSFLHYLNYGCFCGVGGAGSPVDDLDTYVYHYLILFINNRGWQDKANTSKIPLRKITMQVLRYKQRKSRKIQLNFCGKNCRITLKVNSSKDFHGTDISI
jgi:hypothetical protein